ncbi:hypothetical protein SSUST1_0097 [Streptococcus suis ST1]|nr:hypothetical protein SSUST1_0097 [Streptococcus suis ST1]
MLERLDILKYGLRRSALSHLELKPKSMIQMREDQFFVRVQI